MSDELAFSPLQADPFPNEISSPVNEDVPIEEPPKNSKTSFFSINYFRQFFDITIEEFSTRIKISLNPMDKQFLTTAVPPDLYGPIWISFTLVFVSMIFGNISMFLTEKPEYDLTSFMTNITTLSFFIFVVPFLWKYLARNISSTSLPSIISLFGYSLVLAIPIPLICFIFRKRFPIYFGIVLSLIPSFNLFNKLSSATENENASKILLPNLVATASEALSITLVIKNSFH